MAFAIVAARASASRPSRRLARLRPSGENSGNLSNYLHFTTSAGNTTIQISSTGAFSGGFNSTLVDQVVQLTSVNLVGSFTSDAQVIADLLNRGKLITDGAHAGFDGRLLVSEASQSLF